MALLGKWFSTRDAFSISNYPAIKESAQLSNARRFVESQQGEKALGLGLKDALVFLSIRAARKA
jgi:hypothetical protein